MGNGSDMVLNHIEIEPSGFIKWIKFFDISARGEKCPDQQYGGGLKDWNPVGYIDTYKSVGDKGQPAVILRDRYCGSLDSQYQLIQGPPNGRFAEPHRLAEKLRDQVYWPILSEEKLTCSTEYHGPIARVRVKTPLGHCIIVKAGVHTSYPHSARSADEMQRQTTSSVEFYALCETPATVREKTKRPLPPWIQPDLVSATFYLDTPTADNFLGRCTKK